MWSPSRQTANCKLLRIRTSGQVQGLVKSACLNTVHHAPMVLLTCIKNGPY